MKSNELTFDSIQVSDTEYRMQKMAVDISNISDIKTEDQVVFIQFGKFKDAYDTLNIIAPKAWFKSEQDFRDRLKADLSKYIKEAMTRVLDTNIPELGRMLLFMGEISLASYVEHDIFDKEGNYQGGCDSDFIRANLFRMINSSYVCLVSFWNIDEYIDSNESDESASRVRTVYNTLVDNSPIHDGKLILGNVEIINGRQLDTSDKQYIHDSYVMSIVLSAYFDDMESLVHAIHLINVTYNADSEGVEFIEEPINTKETKEED